MTTVTVIGCDGSAIDPALLSGATLVVGAARHLSGVDVEVERIVLGPLAPAVERIAAHEGDVVVLASGDPGFFGVVRALRAAGIRPRVIPAVSSVAAAFARAGLDWDDAVVVSAHGRSLGRVVNVCRAHPKVAVLTGPGAGPTELAAALQGVPRTLLVAENLGTPQERMAGDPPWASLNVVLVIDPSRVDGAGPRWIAGVGPGPAGWALPEKSFAHRDSMITKAEVRALVLARLGPRVGDLVWDVGAGSGSVAAECARFGAAVVAVERDPEAVSLIERNTSELGVQIVAGSAPACLADLPDPDAVFVGGGGLGVLSACARRRPARLVMAVAGVERVGPALRCMGEAGYEAEGVALQASRLHPLPDGTHRLAPVNPVFVVWGELS
ncbi:precorrin-6y C5,15-methyltransferase (decarboxylating) subunit CbiE [Allorhizocola rhizosphaerae]|uniref:precorrin-6y C5,15-methyltransferase (decarboxylating) subunit CbiE n=1 Tax=Allorhizocola rhizosphaerae TaxID=1872709 RepID=UPI000E3E474F|nr:precorrin-6y C5,15-methyltransferase (decarboxylating) subunit CbiE [Allorhizocola rhizosphaerae]